MKKNNPVEDLQEIRKMMEGSSKFLSLSGLSGISAGIVALAGTWLLYQQISGFRAESFTYYMTGVGFVAERKLMINLGIIAAGILVVAVGSAFLFTWLKARKQGQSLKTPLSLRLMGSLAVPLFFGGCFVLIEVKHGYYDLIMPSTLVFYGMALLNASKFVNVDIKYLAVTEMILGLIAFWMLEFTDDPNRIVEYALRNAQRMLVFWGIGFGVMHILYGTIMYFRYDYKKD